MNERGCKHDWVAWKDNLQTRIVTSGKRLRINYNIIKTSKFYCGVDEILINVFFFSFHFINPILGAIPILQLVDILNI